MVTTAPLIFVLFLAAFFAGGVSLIAASLIRSGKRGRLVNDHPICRACGFDLYNLPADRVVCPECGADLKQPKAILEGYRERNRNKLLAGRVLLALTILTFAWTSYQVFTRDASIRLLPHFIVVFEAKHASPLTQRVAWRELVRRVSTDSLSASTVDSMLNHALAEQADTTKRWNPDLGAFVETARKNQQVDDERWARYARQAVQVSLRIRPKVRVGDALPMELTLGGFRTSENSGLVLRNPTPIASGDFLRPLPESTDRGSHGQSMGPGGGGSDSVYVDLDKKAMAKAPLGKRDVAVDVKFTVCEGWADDAPVVATVPMHLAARWELISRDEKVVEHVPDDSPKMREQVEQALSNFSLKVRHQGPWDTIDVDLNLPNLPLPLGYQVVLRNGDQKWEAVRIARPANSGAVNYGFGTSLKNFKVQKVDVYFEPDERAVTDTVNATQLWDGQVVLKDVPVVEDIPATQAAD